jgi:hypothetical protein
MAVAVATGGGSSAGDSPIMVNGPLPEMTAAPPCAGGLCRENIEAHRRPARDRRNKPPRSRSRKF